jgi:hypothetical protein
MRFLFALFLIAHGLVHLMVWLAPPSPDAPFRADHSWLMGTDGTAHRTSVTLALGATTTFVLSGLALLLGVAVWITVAVAASVLGLIVAITFFDRWLLADVGINVGLLYLLLMTEWPASLLD